MPCAIRSGKSAGRLRAHPFRAREPDLVDGACRSERPECGAGLSELRLAAVLTGVSYGVIYDPLGAASRLLLVAVRSRQFARYGPAAALRSARVENERPLPL